MLGNLLHLQRFLPNLNEGIPSAESGRDRLLYAVTDSSQGKILRIGPMLPAADDLADAPQSFNIPKIANIFVRPKQPGVMQSEETIAAETVAYDPARAESLFVQNCGTCYTFEKSAQNKNWPEPGKCDGPSMRHLVWICVFGGHGDSQNRRCLWLI